MAGKRDKPEEIVVKLRQVGVLQGQGLSVADGVRQIGVTGAELPPPSGLVEFLVPDRPLVDGDDGLWRRRLVTEGAVGPDGVVVAAPPLDQDLGFAEREEDLAVQPLVAD